MLGCRRALDLPEAAVEENERQRQGVRAQERARTLHSRYPAMIRETEVTQARLGYSEWPL
jgi:hypothetical protein